MQRNPSGFRFPGGESFTEMQARITGAVDRLGAAHPGQTVVAVSHADPIKAAVAHAMGTHLDLFQRIVVSPCSVSAVLYGVDGPVVLAVNSTGDLTTPRAVMTSLRPAFAGRVHRRHGRAARPARLLPPGPRRRPSSRSSCEKQQVAALAEYFDGLLDDLAPAPYGIGRRRPRARRARRGGLDGRARSASPTTSRPTASWSCSRSYDVEEEETRTDVGESARGVRLTHRAQVVGLRRHAPPPRRGRATAVPLLRPARSIPTGHACPRMN